MLSRCSVQICTHGNVQNVSLHLLLLAQIPAIAHASVVRGLESKLAVEGGRNGNHSSSLDPLQFTYHPN